MEAPTGSFGDWAVIHSYTRRQAVADGVLWDATIGDVMDVTHQHLSRLACRPAGVAATSAVFELILRAVSDPRASNDWRGVWHDVLFMSRPARTLAAADAARDGTGRRAFRVIITGTGRTKMHTLDVHVGPDDDGLPCVTYMLPGED